MVFQLSLSDSKSHQVSRSLLSILNVLNNLVVWMVSNCPLISKSSSPFNSPLVTVPKAPITIGIIVTIVFHNFFNFFRKFQVLILLFTFLQFYSVVSRDSKVHNFVSSLFSLLIIIGSCHLADIRLSVFCFFFFTLWSDGTAMSTIWQVLFFCWLSLALVVWPRLGDLILSQNPRELCSSDSSGRILGCTCTTFSYDQVKISSTIPCLSLSPPRCV